MVFAFLSYSILSANHFGTLCSVRETESCVLHPDSHEPGDDRTAASIHARRGRTVVALACLAVSALEEAAHTTA